MSQRYIGSLISPTAAPTTSTSTTGVWSANDQYQAKNAGNWPMYVPLVTSDPQFNYVTMLLHGDGTNGAQNNTFLDSSTNNFTITRNGNTTQGSLGPYGASWSNYFDGSGDYLSLASNSQFAAGTNNFTIEFWVYMSAVPTGTGTQIFDTRPASTTGAYSLIYAYTDRTIRYFVSSADRITSPVLSLSTWYHVAVVRNSGTTTMYVNGTSAGTWADSTTYLQGGVYIGASYSNGPTIANFFNGYLSNLRFVNGTALYTTTFTPSTTPLTAVAKTSLLTCQSNSFVDNSANTFTVTKNGDTSIQSFSPFGPTTVTPYYSGYFDGTGDYLSTTVSAISGVFTVDFWLYRGGTSSTNNYLFTIGDANATGSAEIYIGTSGTVLNYWSSGASRISGTPPTVNTWSYVAITRDASNVVRMYVDGAQIGSTYTQTGSLNTAVRIGCEYFNSAITGYLTGNISNFRISDTVRTVTSVPTAPFTNDANTVLLTCQSSTFIDNSTNNFAITVAGNSTPRTVAPFAATPTNSVSYSTSVFGGSAYFDGSGDYLTAPNNTALTFAAGEFTIECFVYLNSIPAEVTLLSRWNAGTVGPTGWLLYLNSGVPTFLVSTNGTTTAATVTGTTLITNTWYHLAIVRSGNLLTVYVNGIAGTAVSFSGSIFADSEVLGIGYRRNSGSTQYPINGYMSNIRIVKGTAVYTSNFVPSPTPLTAITNTSFLASMTNGAIYDNAMMNDLETVGNAQISTSVKKYGTGSLAFDGTGDYLRALGTSSTSFGQGDLTVEGWVYSNSISTTQAVIERRSSLAAIGFAIYIDTSKLSFRAGDSTTTSWEVSIDSGTLSSATWYHFAFTRSGTTWRAFVNGTQVGTSVTWAGTIAAETSPWLIGVLYDGSSSLNGYLDDIRLTKGYARYTANFTPPTAAFPNTGPN